MINENAQLKNEIEILCDRNQNSTTEASHAKEIGGGTLSNTKRSINGITPSNTNALLSDKKIKSGSANSPLNSVSGFFSSSNPPPKSSNYSGNQLFSPS